MTTTSGRQQPAPSPAFPSPEPVSRDRRAAAPGDAPVVSTRRPTVAALEDILGVTLPVLDRGFIRVVDYMGGDDAIVQAARVSYGRGTRKLREDRGLIRYLMRHRHTTPFEMCEIKYHVKLPIFVARQWIRHRTASVNEYSARYSVIGEEFYQPAAAQLARQATGNRQGRGAALDAAAAARVMELLRTDAHRNYASYREMLDTHDLARELARMNLTLNVYTEWYWKTDLHNLLRFVGLRADAGAQTEIRAYAGVLADTIRRWAPVAWEAFDDYVAGAATLSRGGLEAVRRLLAGEVVTAADVGLGPREWRDLMATLYPEGRD